jgi:hypothetical protein
MVPQFAPRPPDRDERFAEELFALITRNQGIDDDTADPDVLPAVQGYRSFDEMVADLAEGRRP